MSKSFIRAGEIYFFAGAFVAAFCALWIAAQRFFVAAMIAALPAALSFRFAFGAGAVAGASDFFDSAHRFRCASPMRFLAAALILRRLPFGASGVAAVSTGAPGNIALGSAI